MKKIAIFSCLDSNRVCTGAACLQALHQRSRSFARYEGAELELVAFMRCNGCGSDPLSDPGMQEKLERLRSIGTDVVHIGICTQKKTPGDEATRTECPAITRIAQQLEQYGITVVRGTH